MIQPFGYCLLKSSETIFPAHEGVGINYCKIQSFNWLYSSFSGCIFMKYATIPSSSCLGWGWAPEGTEETCNPRQTRRVMKGILGTALLHNEAMTACKQQAHSNTRQSTRSRSARRTCVIHACLLVIQPPTKENQVRHFRSRQ